MIVALFGITCVGKTTVGKMMADKLGYEFYDLDEEMKNLFNDTISNIHDSSFNRHEFDTKKGTALYSILEKCAKTSIIAVSPIYYTTIYKHLFKKNNVFSIVLHDTPENIAERMIYTDDEDNPIEVNLTVKEKKEELSDIRWFISNYKNAHSRIKNHYHIDGKSPDVVADELINMYISNNSNVTEGDDLLESLDFEDGKSIEKILKAFDDSMIDEELSGTTRKRHCQNAEFYLDFLVNVKSTSILSGWQENHLNEFFLEFYSHEATTPSADLARKTMSSLRKFYEFLHRIEHVKSDELHAFEQTVNEQRGTWMEVMESFRPPQKIWLPPQLQLIEDSEVEVREEAGQHVIRIVEKIGRNDKCPCGSDKKYKKCCG